MKLSVITPTLNEAANVCRLIEELEFALIGIDYEILIVDDNSPDRTWSVAQDISKTHPRVRALRRMENPGLSAAVIDGFFAAEGDALACIDADLQHDPAILARMLDELQQGADVVVGSRHVDGGSTGEWSRLRRLESWIATRTAQSLLGFRLKDPMSGYFLVRRADFCRVKRQLNVEGFKILLEILARLGASKIKEVPYTFRPRTQGQSKLSGRVIRQFIEQLWRLCSSSQRLFVRFMKSVVVGSVGVFANLAVMALLLEVAKTPDWRASAFASLAANAQNYALQNVWTTAEGSRKTFGSLVGYLSYLLAFAPGLVTTTLSYAGFAWSLERMHVISTGSGATAFYAPICCQFGAVLLGIGTMSGLNKAFRPKESDCDVLESAELSSDSSLMRQEEELQVKSPTDLAPETGE